ncbi:Hypothetical protein CINCED_3A013438 [Cinara cedri]|uniref:Transmembrane protein 135 N-terminal domain-containing protein n=1 Tax=Cinara cedri TaxID=506608 RepID=A0A5E4MH00_9HEMI|nr:Hypothetical protein CINCED_3A013438 [Cinara cedri]
MLLSKYIVEGTCSEIVHNWEPNCLNAYRSLIRDSAIGGLKMLLPLLCINYGLRIWRKNKSNDTLAKDLLIDGLRCIGIGPCLTITTVFYSCTIRYFLNRYTIITLTCIPAILSGYTSAWILGSKMTTQILALESIVNVMAASGRLKLNRYNETIFFMFTNACLMYASKLSGPSYTSYTWFFKPDKKRRDEKIYLESIFKKTRYYFGLGIGYGIVRMLIRDTSVLKLKNMHKLFNKQTLKPGIFAGSYVVLYEMIVYAMNRYFQKDRPAYALPAGFLAGLSYAIDPNLAINISAFINLIQILYYLADTQLLRPSLMESIIFGLCYGTMIHINFFYPENTAKIGSRMVELCSNGRFKFVATLLRKNVIYTV